MTISDENAADAALSGTRWVVTGAAGRIGSALRVALHSRGIVLVSTDLREPAPVAADDTVDATDLADLDALTALFAGADGIIHLAGIADEADFHDLAETNIVGTYHVLEAARRAGVPRVVYASSNHANGLYDVDTNVTPEMPPRADGFYGVSKVAAESLCRLYADVFGVRTIAIRIGTYAAVPESARAQRTWLSPDDAVRAFLASMTTDAASSVFFGVSANRERWWDLEAGAAIGFHPQDDAADFGSLEPLPPAMRQGGIHPAPDRSIARMRR